MTIIPADRLAKVGIIVAPSGDGFTVNIAPHGKRYPTHDEALAVANTHFWRQAEVAREVVALAEEFDPPYTTMIHTYSGADAGTLFPQGMNGPSVGGSVLMLLDEDGRFIPPLASA